MSRLLTRLWSVAYVGLFLTVVTLAQTESCPAIVRSVLELTNEICASLGRNQVCYVNLQAEIIPQDLAIRLKFDQPGDLVNLEYVESLVMTPLNTVENTWGVSLMKLQANIPDTVPGQNVSMLLFGDVEIRNEVNSSSKPIMLSAVATTNANVRIAPSINASVLKSLNLNEAIVLDGRNSDGTWVRLRLDNNQSGWVFADLVTVNGDLITLASVVAGEQSTVQTPMQAFYFKTGVGDAACEEAPESGILIQTPAGGQKVNLTANGVNVSLGSTAFLQAAPQQMFTMAIVEGEGTLTVDGETVVVPAGAQSSVPLNENGEPAGAPQDPVPYDKDKLNKLPLQMLPQIVDIAEPLTQDALDSLSNKTDFVDVSSNPYSVAVAPIMAIPGLSQECMNLINKVIEATNNYDVNALVSLESEFTNSGCLAEAEALAEAYGGYSDEDYDSDD